MESQNLSDIIKIALPAIISALAVILAVLLTRRQDRKQFELELREREKDRRKEKIADRIIDVHLKLYEHLSELAGSIHERLWELKPPTENIDGKEVEVEYTGFRYVRTLQKPETRHVREVFVEVDGFIAENKIWLTPYFAEQISDLLMELEIVINDDAIDVFATDKSKAEYLAKPYADILDKIPSLQEKVRASIGIDLFDDLHKRV